MKKSVFKDIKPLAGLLLGLFLGCAAVFIWRGRAGGAEKLQLSFSDVADKVGPSVVSISSTQVFNLGYERYHSDPVLDNFFRMLYGNPQEWEYKSKGLGSGVIISPDGYILTCNHVVDKAVEIEVTLPDGRRFQGIVKGKDIYSDLAVIKIDADGLPYSKMGDSDRVRTGQWAIAIGNPFGFAFLNAREPTVTVGVISALNRDITAGNKYFGDLIQTDAAINKGNSGGPLVNIKGEVIGINTVIFSHSGGYEGISFAVPIKRAKEIVPKLMKGEEVEYGWIGVWLQAVTPEIASKLEHPLKEGALIWHIDSGSPAEKAGLRRGDIVISFDGEKIGLPQQLGDLIIFSKVGTAHKLGFLRLGKIAEAEVVISKKPVTGAVKDDASSEPLRTVFWRDMELSDISPALKKRYNIDITDINGVLVLKVKPDSEAYARGIFPGLIIDEINGIEVKNLQDFMSSAKSVSGKILLHTNQGYLVLGE
ncbi:MAG: trypsin-like peptidase domain-containing protein [Candidatus Aureabacteria bacterium]|nr:trypsin-like peptidase domain-containing protein [Candidatus Auribacterota bacterium]